MNSRFVPPSGRFAPARRAPEPFPDEAPLYQVGDALMHPSEGICTVSALERMPLRGVSQLYYVLKPTTENSSSVIYLPVARGNAILRSLLSESDVRALIQRSRMLDWLWIDDSKQRKEAFCAILSGGDQAKMLRMAAEIRRHGMRRAAEGKKPCAADEAILAEAERRLHQEFSQALRLSPAETAAFIARELDGALSS